MPTSEFQPAWWIPGPHAQTLWGKFFRRQPTIPTNRTRWDTPDGDFVDVHHFVPDEIGVEAHSKTPHLFLLHGLEGTIRSHYVQGVLAEAARRGWHAHVLIFRSCGETLNKTRRFYHSGETSDMDFVLSRLCTQFPDAPFFLAGVSLGGNVLLKYLGERGLGVSPQIKGAAAISVPFDLARGSQHLQHGFATVYERHFLRSLTQKVRDKLNTFPDLLDPATLPALRTLYDFDDYVTAPLHGFRNAEEYYSRSSAIRYLPGISTKTLLLNAQDDPFLPTEVLDRVRTIADSNSRLIVEFPSGGGHAGFVGGRTPLHPEYYLERRIGGFFADLL